MGLAKANYLGPNEALKNFFLHCSGIPNLSTFHFMEPFPPLHKGDFSISNSSLSLEAWVQLHLSDIYNRERNLIKYKEPVNTRMGYKCTKIIVELVLSWPVRMHQAEFGHWQWMELPILARGWHVQALCWGRARFVISSKQNND
jgi:hypothetical protein